MADIDEKYCTHYMTIESADIFFLLFEHDGDISIFFKQ